MKMFKGIDWTIYVKMRNKERKAGDAKKDYEEENLLDEEEPEAPKEEEKQPAENSEEQKQNESEQ